MGAKTSIEWANHTGGPWFICTEVSLGCANCYARQLAQSRLEPMIRKAFKAAGVPHWDTVPVWGKLAPRVLSKGFWSEAIRINAANGRAGRTSTWFPSQLDWLDDCPAGVVTQDGHRMSSDMVLARFMWLVSQTPNLMWLLLTKRPEMFFARAAAAASESERVLDCGVKTDADMAVLGVTEARAASRLLRGWLAGEPPHNVAVGTSVEDQARAIRVRHLVDICARVRFLSVEPMLGPVDLPYAAFNGADSLGSMPGIHWSIFGGESGPGARPCDIDWIRDGVRQCREAGVTPFVKQLGSRPVCKCSVTTGSFSANCCEHFPYPIRHKKGGEPEEWPKDLRIREVPDFESMIQDE